MDQTAQVHPRTRHVPDSGQIGVGRVLLVAGLLFMVAEILLLGMTYPPGSWGDDMALEVDPFYYLNKLQAEGRWLVYAWHRLLGITPRAFDLHMSIAAWCLASTLIAAMITRSRSALRLTLVAAAVVANPAVWELFKWPHISLPTLVVVLAGIALVHALRNRAELWLVAIGLAIAVNMLSYPLFAFLVFATVALAQVAAACDPDMDHAAPRHVLHRAMQLVLVAAGAAALGLLAALGLNLVEFGEFGLRTEPWRYYGLSQPDTNSMTLAWWNIRACLAYLGQQSQLTFALAMAAAGIAFGAALTQRVRQRSPGTWMFCIVIACLFLAAALGPFSISLLHGTPVPSDRGALTLYLAVMGMGATAWSMGAGSASRRNAVVALALFVPASFCLGSSAQDLRRLARDDQHNRALMAEVASQVRATLGPDSLTDFDVILAGKMSALAGAARNEVWWAEWLARHALISAGAREVRHCSVTAAVPTEEHRAIRHWLEVAPAYPEAGYVGVTGSLVLIKMDDSIGNCRIALQ